MATEQLTTEPVEAPAPEPSLRDDLDAAFRQHQTEEVDAPAAPAAAPPADGRIRDEHGRFAPAAPAEPPAGPAAPIQAPIQAKGAPQPTTAPAPDLRAPVSWRPEVREKWATVDPEVKAEVHRREVETQRILQAGAQQRQFIEQFENVVRPYEMFLRAENAHPLQAVANLMSTAAELRVGTPTSKAGLIAGLVQQYGIDIGLLDSALAGKGFTAPGTQPPMPQQPPLDPRFTQFLQMQQQHLQQQEYQNEQGMRAELAAFADKHEFYADVAPTMADLIEVRAQQGGILTLEQAYEMACKMHDGVSKILATRAATPAAPSPAVLRARRAAVSVKGEPTPHGATVPADDSIRASLQAAFDAHSQ